MATFYKFSHFFKIDVDICTCVTYKEHTFFLSQKRPAGVVLSGLFASDVLNHGQEIFVSK